MGLDFISINDKFNGLAKKEGFEVYNMRVEYWVPRRKTYYIRLYGASRDIYVVMEELI
jgi:hypothetical protein